MLSAGGFHDFAGETICNGTLWRARSTHQITLEFDLLLNETLDSIELTFVYAQAFGQLLSLSLTLVNIAPALPTPSPTILSVTFALSI